MAPKVRPAERTGTHIAHADRHALDESRPLRKRSSLMALDARTPSPLSIACMRMVRETSICCDWPGGAWWRSGLPRGRAVPLVDEENGALGAQLSLKMRSKTPSKSFSRSGSVLTRVVRR